MSLSLSLSCHCRLRRATPALSPTTRFASCPNYTERHAEPNTHTPNHLSARPSDHVDAHCRTSRRFPRAAFSRRLRDGACSLVWTRLRLLALSWPFDDTLGPSRCLLYGVLFVIRLALRKSASPDGCERTEETTRLKCGTPFARRRR